MKIRIFLPAETVFCSLPNQHTPSGFNHIERMLKTIIQKGEGVKCCGGCALARGIDTLQIIEAIQINNMRKFAQWTVDCDKVLTF